MRPQPLSSVVATVVAGLAFGWSAPAAAATPLAIETFDAAWTIVHETHFDDTFNGVDWIAVREELRPRAASAADVQELRAVLRDMVGRLGQSHFAIFPGTAIDRLSSSSSGAGGGVAVDLRVVGEDVLVYRVEPGGPAAVAGVRPGWIVNGIGGDRVEDLRRVLEDGPPDEAGSVDELLWIAVEGRLQGAPGESVEVAFVDGDGARRAIRLERRTLTGELVQLGNLPALTARFETEERSTATEGRVGILRMNYWMPPLMRSIDETVERFRRFDAIVIDLRGNQGGVGAMVMGVAGHFFAERTDLGTMRTRVNTLTFFANPRRVNPAGERVAPFAGPVAILTDALSASTSEVFAAGMQYTGRARLFGGRTAGAALPALMERLPNGDVLYHAVADFRTPSGALIEGAGVVPDVAIPLRRDDLLAGRDAVLEAALAWIDESRATRPTGDRGLVTVDEREHTKEERR
jgi:carboxyl-terminal processing protease